MLARNQPVKHSSKQEFCLKQGKKQSLRPDTRIPNPILAQEEPGRAGQDDESFGRLG